MAGQIIKVGSHPFNFWVKRYGICTRNGKTHIRRYNRELKNGKGMDYFQAQYKADPNPLTFREFFDDRKQAIS